MTDDPLRPDPDALLAAARREGRGRLKVFLGMAPGVGKTFEMLASGARKLAAGEDVVAGVIETHGRRDTEALLEPLPVLPRRPMTYRGQTFTEFDLDAALQRRPGLLLVDEYAHSNIPGSRHPKRWQDVEELLDAGINVWTTLNVQHLESLVDVVWRITGVRQKETVPDAVFAAADEIELIDLTPEELRERLAAGKVYVPETARSAADRYFRAENLIALRELALRRAAQTVDDKLVGRMRQGGIEGPWAAGERILVLIGPDATAAPLVRVGRRLADLMMDARWTVLHVERPNSPPSPEDAAQVSRALRLAEQLGGQTARITADDLPAAVLDYSSRHNITQLVIGRTPRTGWRRLLGASLAHVLLERASGTALHVITDPPSDDAVSAVKVAKLTPLRLNGALVALAATLTAMLASAALDHVASGANLAMLFLLAVLATGLTTGLAAALTAAALCAVSYNFFFLEPRLSLVIGNPADILTFAVFFVVASAAGFLAGRVKDQARTTSRRAAAVASLLTASRALSAAATRDAAAAVLAQQIAVASAGAGLVLLPERDELVVAASTGDARLTPGEMAAARWAWEKGEAAGAGTGTLPELDWTFHPLQGLKSRVGVAGIDARRSSAEAESERLLLALLDQGAVALERADLASAAADAEAFRRSDRLRAALLNSISHDLRTPLSTVLGAATTLLEFGEGLKPAVRADLLGSIREEADRLNRYVGDLLDMTRLEGGGLNTKVQWVDVRDVLSAAIQRVERRAGGRTLTRDYPAELSMIKADPTLLEQAVVNVLENAIAYSPDPSPIEVAAYEDRSNVVISIEDEGKGIPTPELERVFDKFRRLEEPSDRGKGIGLGLSISKGFVDALGGRIAAASPIHGDVSSGLRGTRVLISLPKAVATHHLIL